MNEVVDLVMMSSGVKELFVRRLDASARTAGTAQMRYRVPGTTKRAGGVFSQ